MPTAKRGHVGTQDDVVLARIGAFILDHFLSFLTALLFGFLTGFVWQSQTGILLGVLLGFGGYFIVQEGLYGQTIGKRAAGIVVVCRDGQPITFGQSIVRNLLRVVDGLFSYALGLAVMLVNDDRQRIGDLAADTIVVRARRR